MWKAGLILINCHLALCRAEGGASGDQVLPDPREVKIHYLPPSTSQILSTNLAQTGPNLFPGSLPTLYHASPNLNLLPPHGYGDRLGSLAAGNPLVAALLLGQTLGIQPNAPGFNHPQHLPTNPYLALLLSHYGRYIPIYGLGRGIYGYTAANNYHNNLPFGSYKLYEDRDV